MTDAEALSAQLSAPVEDKPEPERKVIATLVQGTVKWFNVRNGYGFINRNDTKEDVFVHQTAIKKNNPRKFLRSVGDGEVVEFDVIEATKKAKNFMRKKIELAVKKLPKMILKGSEAANVTGPGGVPVKGSRYAPNKRRFRRRFFPRSPRPGDQAKSADGQGSGVEGDASGDDGIRPLQRRRRPRRLQQEGQTDDTGEAKTDFDEDDQTRQPQRRFWRPYRRPFRPRPPSNQATDDPQSMPESQEQGEVKQTEASMSPQTNDEGAEGQKQRNSARRRRQRNSTSKSDTEKSASEPSTLPQTSKSPKSSPKTSPKSPDSPEEAAATTIPASSE